MCSQWEPGCVFHVHKKLKVRLWLSLLCARMVEGILDISAGGIDSASWHQERVVVSTWVDTTPLLLRSLPSRGYLSRTLEIKTPSTLLCTCAVTATQSGHHLLSRGIHQGFKNKRHLILLLREQVKEKNCGDVKMIGEMKTGFMVLAMHFTNTLRYKNQK
jgi:hypothetical protein